MTHSRCGADARWCARADAIFDVAGMHVLDVEDDRDGRLIVTVESDQVETGCTSFGAIVASHGRRSRMRHDAALPGADHDGAVAERMWRCREPACSVGVVRETHDIARRARSSRCGPFAGPPTLWPMMTRRSRRWAAIWVWAGTPPGTPLRSRRRPGPATRPDLEM